jgi:hypothetical protein
MNTSVKNRIPDLSAMGALANMSMGGGKGGFVIPANAFTLDQRPGVRNMLRDFSLRRITGLIPAVFGGAALQGYHTEGDIVRYTTDNVDVNSLWAEYQRVLNMYNAQRQPIIDLLTYSVPRNIERVPQVGNEAAFERASEFGVPKGIRTGVSYFNMGFSFDWYDTGARYTWRFLADADRAQVDSVNTAILEADNRLIFNTVMWTLFNNANRTAEIEGQDVNVYTFYNNDGTVPPPYGPNTFDGTHTHFLASGAATVDSGDLDLIQTHMNHHGYSRANGYDLVVLSNEAEVDVIRTFKSVQNGGTAKFDFIPAQGTANFLLPVNFVVNGGASGQPGGTYRGITVAGRYGDLLILTNDYFPAGYLVGFATGGQENVNNPIGIREHSNAAFRGLRLIKGREPDYPLQDAYYLRGFGTGVRHRGASVVMKITAGAYAAPTAYTSQP